jgi:hypothetical protein
MRYKVTIIYVAIARKKGASLIKRANAPRIKPRHRVLRAFLIKIDMPHTVQES